MRDVLLLAARRWLFAGPRTALAYAVVGAFLLSYGLGRPPRRRPHPPMA